MVAPTSCIEGTLQAAAQKQNPSRAQQVREVEKTKFRVWGGKDTGVLRAGNQGGGMREKDREETRKQVLETCR